MLFVATVVAVGGVNPPDRISGVPANAPFDVMQVSRGERVAQTFKRGRSGAGAVTAAGNARASSFSLFREPLKQMGPVLRSGSLGNVPDMNAHLRLGRRNFGLKDFIGQFSFLRPLSLGKSHVCMSVPGRQRRPAPWMTPTRVAGGTKGFAWTDEATVALISYGDLLLKWQIGVGVASTFLTSHTCAGHTRRHTLGCCRVVSRVPRCPIFFFFLFFFLIKRLYI